MCVNKIRILNKGFNPFDILSTKYIYVNCGKCWQCRLERSNSFSFRIMQELAVPNSIPFFVTFTYNDKYLPVLTYNKVDKDKGSVPVKLSCWNRQHLQKLHKAIRRQLHYYFGISSNSFKYLVTCERGSSDEYISDSGYKRVATSRPHYHAIYILRCDSNINNVRSYPSQFIDYCKANVLAPCLSSFFRYLLNSRWFYGHVDDIAFCRDIVACVRYVCKYILKSESESICKLKPFDIVSIHDLAWDESNKKWLDSGKLIGFDGVIPCYEYFKKPPKPINLSDCLPRPISSINLGIDFIKNQDVKELERLLTGKTTVVLPAVKSCSKINLPNYYYRKLCYKTNFLHENRLYAKRFNTKDGVIYGCLDTSVHYVVSDVWDNVNGFYHRCVRGSRTESVLSFFGRYIQKLRLINQYKTLKNFRHVVLLSRSFFDNVVRCFYSFPSSIRQYFVDVSNGIYSVLQENDFSFSSFIKHRVFESYDSWFNLIHFFQLCQFTQNHLRHIAFEVAYQKKLPSSAFNNPDLFISHFM